MSEQTGPDHEPRQVRDLPWVDAERLAVEQQALHPAIDRITAWAEEYPTLFAGVWIDNTDVLQGSGPVRIGVGLVHGDRTQSSEATEAVEALTELVGDPRLLHVVQMAHSQQELRQVQDQIVARYLGHDLGAARVTGCGVDVEANTMTVMLNKADAQAEARLRAEFESFPLRIEYGELRALPLELDQP